MSTLRKVHVLGAGSGALLAGGVGAVIGGFVAGHIGITVGAAAGAAVGAVVGDRISEQRDKRDDLGHFQQIFHTMPYYVDAMRWDDYAPAYDYGIRTYRTHGGQPFAQVEDGLAREWEAARGGSRLSWVQAQPAVAHAWHELDDTLHARGRGPAVA